MQIYTSCYDGFLRLMNAEKEVFDLVYSSDDAIFSLSQQPNNVHSLYFGEGRGGGLNSWDERTGRFSSQWILHADRINSIDFNSQNPNIMATSSTDGTACLWDLRSVNADKPKSLKILNHNRAVHSAYFSPSGSCLATTRYILLFRHQLCFFSPVSNLLNGTSYFLWFCNYPCLINYKGYVNLILSKICMCIV